MKARLKNPYWTMMLPLWVSRPLADGTIMSMSVPGWLHLLISVLILTNVLVWSVIGLITAGTVIF